MLDPRLHRLLAEARVDELRGAAASSRRSLGPPPPESRPTIDLAITLRYGFPDDAQAIARLAALDSAEPPLLPILLAEVAGELRAALSLADGSVISDPFYSTRGLIDLLSARAQQLERAELPGRGSRARWRGRLRLSAPR
jgi:hypothetical protein